MTQFDNRLEEMSEDLIDNLTCPECDGNLTRADIVQILAPNEVENQSIETYKNTVGGAGVLATAGALFGPAGIVVGGAAGSILGGMRGQKRDKLRRIEIQCPHCGNNGCGC